MTISLAVLLQPVKALSRAGILRVDRQHRTKAEGNLIRAVEHAREPEPARLMARVQLHRARKQASGHPPLAAPRCGNSALVQAKRLTLICFDGWFDHTFGVLHYSRKSRRFVRATPHAPLVEQDLMVRQHLVQHALGLKRVLDEASADDFPVLRVLAAKPPDCNPGEVKRLHQPELGVEAAAC
jgi:hypothetical protein